MLNHFDIHAHLNFPEFDEDREEVVARAKENSVGIINVGVDKESSLKAVELADKFDDVYSIVGLHPNYTCGDGEHYKSEEFDIEFYKNLCANPKVVGIGECGLDYFRTDPSLSDIQKREFIKQIHLANEVKKPLMLHIRQAYSDAIEVLKKESKEGGNVHFFAGTWEEGQKFLDLGFTLSFTGVVTFAKDYEELVKNTPLDMLMVETDCPYATPVPHRGKRNEPSYVVEIVAKIAQIKGLPANQVAETIRSNVRRVFRI